MDKNNGQNIKISISVPTLSRLPLYYSFLKAEANRDIEYISGAAIGKYLDLTSIQVRKDLESIGAKGRPKIGYSKEMLINLIGTTLGYDNDHDAFLVGVGNLGKALLGYKIFEEYGLNIIAGFDNSEDVIGSEVNEKMIFDIKEFEKLAKRMGIKIGIITVDASKAQNIADMMVASGIEAIWNFAPVHIKLPDNIISENVNMASSLAVLSNKLKQKEEGALNDR